MLKNFESILFVWNINFENLMLINKWKNVNVIVNKISCFMLSIMVIYLFIVRIVNVWDNGVKIWMCFCFG